ncbi:hypothetical protein [Thermoanaerobacterium thermosaccharolyticum]|uniref:hypothetical protein n=1 Tax=Thermoanaerobacterium thermosaccharolyticum TaxID=1517 RepID=UPI0015DF9DCE|nr:hypothetical protein [Thermoanaerobacterium thermosaccharolyticum]
MDYIVKPNNVVKPDYSVCQNDPCYADCASFSITVCNTNRCGTYTCWIYLL